MGFKMYAKVDLMLNWVNFDMDIFWIMMLYLL
jgi:hypothetical protein